MFLVPDNWTTIEITNLTNGDALHDHSYTLICNVNAIQRMNIAPVVHWYYPNGSQVETGGRLVVGTAETVSPKTTLSLTFSPVLHEDGSLYSCRASVTVPWMTSQPPAIEESINMKVTSKHLN